MSNGTSMARAEGGASEAPEDDGQTHDDSAEERQHAAFENFAATPCDGVLDEFHGCGAAFLLGRGYQWEQAARPVVFAVFLGNSCCWRPMKRCELGRVWGQRNRRACF